MQQVNLYQPIFRKQEKVFSAKTMMQGAVVVLIGLLLFTIHVYRQGYAIEEQLHQTEQLRDERTRQLVEASGLFPAKIKSADLEQQVAYYRQQVALRQRLLAALNALEQGGASGFSEHLAAVARQRTPQLWLQRVGLREGGGDLILDGFSFDPDQIPQFIQKLSEEQAFKGQMFSHFAIARDAEDDRRVGFSLRTVPPKEGVGTVSTGGYVSLKEKARGASR